MDGSLLQERLVSMLSSVFGGLALALACIGLYGLLSYTVLRRTREFGVRIALGARRSQVIWIVLKETVLLVGTALLLGLAIVFALGDFVKSVLFHVSPTDPLAIGASVALLLAIGLAAAYVPARRASSIEPTRALRQE